MDNIFVERLWRSVKYEHLYLRGYTGLPELLTTLTGHFEFYNQERKLQSLGHLKPNLGLPDRRRRRDQDRGSF